MAPRPEATNSQSPSDEVVETVQKYVKKNNDNLISKAVLVDAFDELNITNPYYAAAQAMKEALDVEESGSVTATEDALSKISRYASTKRSTRKIANIQEMSARPRRYRIVRPRALIYQEFNNGGFE